MLGYAIHEVTGPAAVRYPRGGEGRYTDSLMQAENVIREGTDVTIVANLLYVSRALEAAEELQKMGISAEVIDPMTLVPFDKETVINSVKKTGRLVVVHEAHRTAGWGAEVAAMVTEEAFRYLDAAPVRLGTKACPLPFNVELENAATPQIADIVAAARSVCYR